MLSNTGYFILTSITITAANSCKCVSNNKPNFKALEFLKAKFWPETPFLSRYDTSELLEFWFVLFFFFCRNLFAVWTLILEKDNFNSPSSYIWVNTIFFFFETLYMYGVRGWDWMHYFIHSLLTVPRYFKSIWFLLTETCYRLWKSCIHQAHLYLWQQKRNIFRLLERVHLPLSCCSASLIPNCLKMLLYSVWRPSSTQFICQHPLKLLWLLT